jgi:hypothetical protein
VERIGARPSVGEYLSEQTEEVFGIAHLDRRNVMSGCTVTEPIEPLAVALHRDNSSAFTHLYNHPAPIPDPAR